MRYVTTPEYREHVGCDHPVHDHNNAGCLNYRCRCRKPRRELVAPSGIRQTLDLGLRAAGLWWLLSHVYGFFVWFF
jgi:hypothetical protein